MKKVFSGLLIILGLNSCGVIFGHKTADAIKSPQALELYQEAQVEDAKGSEGFEKAIELLNKADQIEPKNAIILHERGLIKIHSNIDIEGGFKDLQRSIDYSKDEKGKLMRYKNRGISFKQNGEMDKACEDWSRAGKHGESYIEKYCK
ncbi:tetratricopeptide repeat protein [Halocola ammonii]